MSVVGIRQYKSRSPRQRFDSMPAPVKRTPGSGGPLFVLWSDYPPVGHRSYSNPRILVRARNGFWNQYFRPLGLPGSLGYGSVPAEFDTSAYMSGKYNTRNAATDLPDLTSEEKAARNTAFARWVARTYCDNLYLQGLIRGNGYADGGAAGGCFDLGESTEGYYGTGTAVGAGSIARKCMALVFDPRDACAKVATVQTSAGPRQISLPLRTVDCREPTLPTAYNSANYADAVALDQLSFSEQQAANVGSEFGVRHTGYATYWTRNGVAENLAFMQEVAYWLRQMIDGYYPYGSSIKYQLCEPSLCLHSLEQQFLKAERPLPDYRSASNGWPQDQYQQVGSFWNARADGRFATEVIYKKQDASGRYTIGMTMRDMLLDHPELAALATSNAPGLLENAPGGASNGSLSAEQHMAFNGVNYDVMSHALAECMQPLKDAFPALKIGNYGLVRVPDRTRPYVTVGNGLAHTQYWLRQDLQCPTIYGRTWDTSAIRAAGTQAALDAAVAAWDNNNFTECTHVIDTLDPDREIAPFVFGVEDPAAIRAGTKAYFGGSARFFADMAVDLYSKGCGTIPIYSGDLDRTTAAIEMVCAEQGWK